MRGGSEHGVCKKIRVVKKNIPVTAYQTTKHVDIKTLEGIMHANPGDWILTGPKGERWPVRKDIFELTYRIID